MCSAIVTIASGNIANVSGPKYSLYEAKLPILKGKINSGTAIQLASFTGVKSTSPINEATTYPPIIATKNGTIFRKPFAFVDITTLMTNATKATIIGFIHPLATSPALVTA